MKTKKFLINLILILLISGKLLAGDISFQASVDRNKVSLGSAVNLNLAFYGTQHMPAPKLSEIDGFQSRYQGPSTRMSIVNGKVSNSITHIYTLIPLRVGKFKIGPLSFKYKKKTYASKQITIEVVEGNVSESEGTQYLSGEASELGDNILLRMYVSKKDVYLNQIIPLTIKLYVSKLAVRDIEYPKFSHNGFSVDKFAKPSQYREVLNGKEYEVIEFKTNVFGTKTSELVLGPAQIKCNLLVNRRRQRNSSLFENFFGGREVYPLSLKSEEVHIIVKDLPAEGRPEDFSCAVGNFTFDLKAEPKEVNIGDPITLKMIIKGSGNFNTVTCPKLDLQKGFKIYDPEVKQEDGTKIFEQILMPDTDAVKEIPKITFSYFDPDENRYRNISRGPVPIKATKSKGREGLKIV
ncbi:protein BatD, partial [bacterium]|nr:protein BatD [bacterium]